MLKTKHLDSPLARRAAYAGLLFLLALAMMACVRFHPKPISAAASMDDFEARRLDAPELREFLLANKEVKELAAGSLGPEGPDPGGALLSSRHGCGPGPVGCRERGTDHRRRAPQSLGEPFDGIQRHIADRRGHALDSRDQSGAPDRGRRQARLQDCRGQASLRSRALECLIRGLGGPEPSA